jgi:hypothetical protein
MLYGKKLRDKIFLLLSELKARHFMIYNYSEYGEANIEELYI